MIFLSFSKQGLTPRPQPYFGVFPQKIPSKICQFFLGSKMTLSPPHFWKWSCIFFSKKNTKNTLPKEILEKYLDRKLPPVGKIIRFGGGFPQDCVSYISLVFIWNIVKMCKDEQMEVHVILFPISRVLVKSAKDWSLHPSGSQRHFPNFVPNWSEKESAFEKILISFHILLNTVTI